MGSSGDFPRMNEGECHKWTQATVIVEVHIQYSIRHNLYPISEQAMFFCVFVHFLSRCFLVNSQIF